MSKQDEYNDLMDFIHHHYSDKKIKEYNSYSCLGKEDAPQVTVTVSTDALWHFNPHSDDDKVREKKLIEEIRIDNYVVNV